MPTVTAIFVFLALIFAFEGHAAAEMRHGQDVLKSVRALLIPKYSWSPECFEQYRRELDDLSRRKQSTQNEIDQLRQARANAEHNQQIAKNIGALPATLEKYRATIAVIDAEIDALTAEEGVLVSADASCAPRGSLGEVRQAFATVIGQSIIGEAPAPFNGDTLPPAITMNHQANLLSYPDLIASLYELDVPLIGYLATQNGFGIKCMSHLAHGEFASVIVAKFFQAVDGSDEVRSGDYVLKPATPQKKVQDLASQRADGCDEKEVARLNSSLDPLFEYEMLSVDWLSVIVASRKIEYANQVGDRIRHEKLAAEQANQDRLAQQKAREDRTQALRAGTIQVRSLGDAELAFSPERSMDVVFAPPVLGNDRYYRVIGRLESVDEAQMTFLFSAEFPGDIRYFTAIKDASTAMSEGTLRFGMPVEIVGRYLGTAQYETVNGEHRQMAVFKAAFIQIH